MKNIIKKILKEEQISLFGGESEYKTCSHFTDKDENELCNKIHDLRSFLFDKSGLGLHDIIMTKIEQMTELMDVNKDYQLPLKLLYDTKKYNNPNSRDYIHEKNGYYENTVLKTVRRVLDDKGKFDYVNKLNTNYSDLAELITELLKRGGMVQKLNQKNSLGVKNYLLSIKDKLGAVLNKYINLDEYKSFVRNSRDRSKIGEKSENDVRTILEKYGMKYLYQGGDGDFIDMLFGIDLIMDDGGKTTTIQVKSKKEQAKKDLSHWRYKKVDFLVAPTDNGIVMYGQINKEIIIDKNGWLISKSGSNT
jgi:hypothetical protein